MVDCPVGHGDAGVTSIASPDGGKVYTCFFSHDGGGSISWHEADPSILSTEGVTADLVGPFEQILRALPHSLIEYGVLEYRLRLDYPDLFAGHVAARGHYLTGAGQATASSVRFAMALGRLERANVVIKQTRAATGAWSYNGQVTYYALLPQPDIGAILTWAEYCAEIGRDPEWSQVDRDKVAAMVAAVTPIH